ncbi:MAG TPA: hypothetical protein VHJ20_00300 [Polyangia bacterium]|nr:hypothetical protein [Polyangia bacterium]
MPLVFREAHAAPDKKKINEEYFILENTGASAINTRGLQVLSSKQGQRGSFLGTIDPGFMLQPGEKILIASGSPGKKSQGEPPAPEKMRVYHLLQRECLLRGAGTTIRFTLNQMEIAKLVFDPAAPTGVSAETG